MRRAIVIALAAVLLLCGCLRLPEGANPATDPGEPTLPELEGVPVETLQTAVPRTEPPESGPPETGPPETEAPETEPAETEVPSELETRLRDYLDTLGGTWSVYVKNVDSGLSFCINDESMIAASLIKLYVAGAYFKTGSSVSPELVDVMIDRSDNEACNQLIGALGMQTINAFIRENGWDKTLLTRKMLQQTGTENYTSTRECGQVLEQILEGTYVDAEASARLLQDLKNQERTSKLPAGVPAGVETANKTGELMGTENDAAIVWSPGGTYIVCVMSNGIDNTTAQSAIRQISAMVYEAFNGEGGA